MKLYNIYFRTPEKEYKAGADQRFASKKTKIGPNLVLNLNAEGFATILESDIKKYWDYGGGVDRCIFAGEIDDAVFAPVLTDHEFVEEQIKSKKNGETIGYQG